MKRKNPITQALDALAAYARANDSDDPLPDLLADLMHYCEAHPHANFERALDTARDYYRIDKG